MEGQSEKLGGIWHLVLSNVPLAPGTVLRKVNVKVDILDSLP